MFICVSFGMVKGVTTSKPKKVSGIVVPFPPKSLLYVG